VAIPRTVTRRRAGRHACGIRLVFWLIRGISLVQTPATVTTQSMIEPGLRPASPKNGNIRGVSQRLSPNSVLILGNREQRDGTPNCKSRLLAGLSATIGGIFSEPRTAWLRREDSNLRMVKSTSADDCRGITLRRREHPGSWGFEVFRRDLARHHPTNRLDWPRPLFHSNQAQRQARRECGATRHEFRRVSARWDRPSPAIPASARFLSPA
jgi:hypothetical protein